MSTAQGVRLCRPSEVVLDLLYRLPPGPFRKEDGELLINDQGPHVLACRRSAYERCHLRPLMADFTRSRMSASV